ncbi:dihydropteroate synthase [Lentisalinibacter sediminis]|uniref:dihydropteroate synthase n=1 Tax=Lentisalinibacter sediminis TaxID=2992237 RepID=UPI003866D3E5
MSDSLQLGETTLDLSSPVVMGVLNVTPDSFSDGGRFIRYDEALEQARAMVGAGAVIVDVGGESTRPGAEPVSVQRELDRVLPVIEAIRSQLDVAISVDTSKPQVMREAVAAGASMINDVCALRRPGALEAAAALGAGVCLMHMQGEPRTMQADPRYDDVVAEVTEFLVSRAADCEAAGIGRERIVIDPGFGFGKTVAHNLALLSGLGTLRATGYTVLAGLSRKSLLAALTGRPVEERMVGSVVLAALAAEHGAHIIRAHDVAETRDALAIVAAVARAREQGEGT